MQIGVNHLGHFYLTSLLWDLLKKSEFFRVINVSGHAYYMFGKDINMDFDDFHSEHNYNKWRNYGKSKLANILFTKALQRKIDI